MQTLIRKLIHSFVDLKSSILFIGYSNAIFREKKLMYLDIVIVCTEKRVVSFQIV